MFQYTGEYKKHSALGRSSMEFYTFTPSPLCDGLPLPVDDELFALLTTAHRLLGVLEGLITLTPDIKIIRDLCYLKESCSSLLIDGKNSIEFFDALKIRSANKAAMYHIDNLTAAQKYARGKHFTSPELITICTLIKHGVGSTQNEEIRTKQIYSNNALTNLKIYTPTAPEDIQPALYDLTKFIAMDNHTDALIKAALVHYQFEMIHPFEHRNGVVGRVLIPMMLESAGYEAAPYLCISEYLYHNKDIYFDKLSSTQRGSGYALWVKFFVQAVCYASEKSIAWIKQFALAAQKEAPIIAELAKSSKAALPVYEYFRKNIASEIKPVAEAIGVSYNTAAKVVNLLQDAGIVKLENEQARHKVFLYHGMAL